MMILICSESFLSISAIMAEMVLVTSPEINWVEARAWEASVRTALATAVCFWGSRALNSLFSRDSNSLTSAVAGAPAACAADSGGNIAVPLVLRGYLLFSGLSFRVGSSSQGLHEVLIVQKLADQFLGFVF